MAYYSHVLKLPSDPVRQLSLTRFGPLVCKGWFLLALVFIACSHSESFAAQEVQSLEPTIHFVATAHLDTEWRWTVRETISKYLPDTLQQNFMRFEKFPDYIFNFEGGIRYMFMKDYHPELFDQLKEYVHTGRWNISGPGLVAFDVNLPAPESLIRSMLYAQDFYQKEFGTNAPDVFLPDCFGFSYALPSLAVHCGMNGFSTQKLGWNSAAGIPFRVGFWHGVDGSVLPCVLHAELYTSIIRHDFTKNPQWLNMALETGRSCGIPRAYHYFGTGDQGGAPDEASIAWLHGFQDSDGPLRARIATSKDLFCELSANTITQKPFYRGEFLLTRHGTGAYTSKARIKKWNRQGEQLAAAAEHAAAAASATAGFTYPQDALTKAWLRLLLHHFHDSITGVSIGSVNDMILNDLQLAMNRYAYILEDAVTAWSERMDTQGEGLPVVVYNPSGHARNSLIEISIPACTNTHLPFLRVTDNKGHEIPSQMISNDGSMNQLLFSASVPAVGLSVYHIQPAKTPFPASDGLSINTKTIENPRYSLTINDQGELASIWDKNLSRELLSAPIQLQLLPDYPREWSEWEIEYADIMAPPALLNSTPTVTVSETGPLRATLRIEREQGDSTFTDYISLCSTGPSDRVHIRSIIDWHTTGTLAKIAVPLSFGNEEAVYDIGLGTIARGTNTPTLYEVPAHQWVDLYDTNLNSGVTILNDCKYGWDHPDAHTLRMTVLHSPNDILIDMGQHEYTYELFGHAGKWTNGVQQAASELNQPLHAFVTDPHAGPLGGSFSFLSISDPGVELMALKQSEAGDMIVIRLAEAHGTAHTNVILHCATSIEEAWLLNGVEKPISQLPTNGKQLSLEFSPYSLRTIALKLHAAPPLPTPTVQALALECDTDITRDPHIQEVPTETCFFASSLWPTNITSHNISHHLEPSTGSHHNARSCDGKTIALPNGDFNALSILATSLTGDQDAVFESDGYSQELLIPGFIEPIMQDNAIRPGRHGQNNVLMRQPTRIKKCHIAAINDYCISTNGQVIPYQPASIFQYILPLSSNQKTHELILPDNPSIKILAITCANISTNQTSSGSSTFKASHGTHIDPEQDLDTHFLEQTMVALQADPKDAEIRYTLNGDRPTPQSVLYTHPFAISTTLYLRARAFHSGLEDNEELKLLFNKHELHAAMPYPPPLKPKLKYSVYHGDWHTVPDTSLLTTQATGFVSQPVLPDEIPGDHFAVEFNGYLHILKDDVYTFYVTSDDGCHLYIDGVRIVNNDGLHPPLEKAATIALASGYHSITIVYFEGTASETLDIQMASNHHEKQHIPSAQLFHAKASWFYSILQKLQLKPITPK